MTQIAVKNPAGTDAGTIDLTMQCSACSRTFPSCTRS